MTDMATDRRRRPPAHRDTLVALMAEHKSFRSAAQLHDELHDRGQWVGIATIYRLLEAMTQSGEVDRITDRRGARYRLCSSNAEHHCPLICSTCDTAIEADGTDLIEWANAAAAEHGFSDAHVKATVIGTCPRCHTSQEAADGLPVDS